MPSSLRLSSLTLLAALAVPSMATAQGARLSYIVQGSYGADIAGSGEGAMGFGGGIGFPLAKRDAGGGVRGVATFDWFFPKDATINTTVLTPTYWEFNINGVLDVQSVRGLYVGTGVNYTTYSIDGSQVANAGGTELGLNILSGIKLGSGHGAPFAQARFEIGGGKQLVLTGGIEF
jgi:hypothetical protein